MNSVKSLVCR